MKKRIASFLDVLFLFPLEEPAQAPIPVRGQFGQAEICFLSPKKSSAFRHCHGSELWQVTEERVEGHLEHPTVQAYNVHEASLGVKKRLSQAGSGEVMVQQQSSDVWKAS